RDALPGEALADPAPAPVLAFLAAGFLAAGFLAAAAFLAGLAFALAGVWACARHANTKREPSPDPQHEGVTVGVGRARVRHATGSRMPEGALFKTHNTRV